jgi:purine-binding chemotaxis protein CheW
MSAVLRTYPEGMPWAIVQVKSQLFAIPTQDMREIIMAPETARVPNVPEYILGVSNIRGVVMPVLDLRKRIGLPSALEETEAFCALMEQREQDHRKWLAELEASVNERRPFGLTTDPHKCAFGKWYDVYRSDNPWIAAQLRKFDAPHKQIHGIGVEVSRLASQNAYAEAKKLVAQTRQGALSKMLKLFAELKEMVRDTSRGTAIILVHNGKPFAAVVDVAVSVEKLPPGHIEEVAELVRVKNDGVVRRLAKRAKADEIVLLLETDRLLAGFEMPAA